MQRRIFVTGFLSLLIIFFAAGANAADMNANYLAGNWVIGTTEQKCDASDAEYFLFHENGTFEAGRSSIAEAVGFWRIDGDIVYLDFVSSGGFFQDIHAELKAYADAFDYFHVKLIHFNVEENRFEGVGVLGDQVNKGIAIRCK